MSILRTRSGDFPLNNLKDYGDYLVYFNGGRLIKHTERIYVYENRVGVRYGIRMADENVVLEYKQYYDKYACKGVYVGIRKSEENRRKMSSGDAALFMGLFTVPAPGEKVIITPANPGMREEGYIM